MNKMKKTIFVFLALLISTLSFTQEKQLIAIEEALNEGKIIEAKRMLKNISSIIQNNNFKSKAFYYFLKGKTYQQLSTKEIDTEVSLKTSGEAYNKLISFEREHKDFNFTNQAKQNLQIVTSKLLDRALTAQQEKDYNKASNILYTIYRLEPENQDLLYFAASNSITGKDYDKALKHYEELLANNYIGEKTISRLPEILKNISWIYTNYIGDNKKALAATEEAIKISPEDTSLLLTKGNIYYKMGDTVKFKEIMEEIISINPNNVDSYYNIGVISAENGNIEEARVAYEKVLELDPGYTNASINLTKTYLDEASNVADKMNNLGSSSTDNKKFNEYQKQQIDLYRKALIILENTTEITPDNLSVLNQLKGLYTFLGEDEKLKKLKAKLIELGQ